MSLPLWEAKKKERFVCRSYDQLYNLKAFRAPIREEFLLLVQHLPPTVSTALRAIVKAFLEDIRTAVLSSPLCSKAVKEDRKWSKRFREPRITRGLRSEEYKVQKQGQICRRFGRIYNADKSSAVSQSEFLAVFAPPSVKTKPVVSSLASLDTCRAALEQASRW